MMVGGIGSSVNMEEIKSQMFQRVDTNSDGGVDKSEFSEMSTKMSEITGEEVDTDELFATLDSDEDGLLSQSEMEAGRTEFRKGMDGLKSMSNMNRNTLNSQIDIRSLLNTEDSDEVDITDLLTQQQQSQVDLASLLSTEDEAESYSVFG